jgi:protein-arginine kinase
MATSLESHPSRRDVDRDLDPELLRRLADRCTVGGWTLADLTRSRRANPDAKVGLYAGDAASYRVFAPLLDPIIAAQHGACEQPRAAGWTRPRVDPGLGEDPALLSAWVCLRRNLRGVAFAPLIDRRARLEVEARVVAALLELRRRYPGEYSSLASLSLDQQVAITEEGLGFEDCDRFLIAAGITRDWPSGRGLWRGADRRRAIRVNGEDHLELLAWEHGGRLSASFCAARELADALEDALGFCHDERLGYLTSCPTNLGTGLRVSVVARLPRLAGDPPRLHGAARELGLDLRRAGSAQIGELVELSNHSRLGCSDVARVERFALALAELLDLERAC